MDLFIFDIDGTLTNTMTVEDACFCQAFEETFGLDIRGVDWADLEHVTDLGISTELLWKLRGSGPSDEELTTFENRFVELLGLALAREPDSFGAVPGALEFFRELHASEGCQVAIATGSWGQSARLKLNAVGLDPFDFPFGNSDGRISRQEITRFAIAEAERRCQSSFRRLVYFGDGEWDFRTCRSLSLPFVGVDCQGTGRLVREGAPLILEDFRSRDLVWDLIHRAWAAK